MLYPFSNGISHRLKDRLLGILLTFSFAKVVKVAKTFVFFVVVVVDGFFCFWFWYVFEHRRSFVRSLA